MIWLDIVFLVPLLWGAYSGFKKGLIAQVLGLTSLFAGVWLGVNYQEMVSPFLVEKVQEKYLSISCFIVLFFSVIILGAITTKIMEKFANFIQLKLINKLVGLILGVLKISSFLVIAVSIFQTWDSQSIMIDQSTKENSLFFPVFNNIGNSILPNLNHNNLLDHIPNIKKETGKLS
jgi:membrane protein required for colicin V production